MQDNRPNKNKYSNTDDECLSIVQKEKRRRITDKKYVWYSLFEDIFISSDRTIVRVNFDAFTSNFTIAWIDQIYSSTDLMIKPLFFNMIYTCYLS